MNDMTGKVLIWVVVIGTMLFLFSRFMPPAVPATAITYSKFLDDLDNNRVESVVLQGDIIEGAFKDTTRFRTYNPESRCAHADADTVLACLGWGDTVFGHCRQCIEAELDRRAAATIHPAHGEARR